MTSYRTLVDTLVSETIAAVLPDKMVTDALAGRTFPGRVFVVAIGKAGWQMAKAAHEVLGAVIADGIVITKYDHVREPLPGLICREAGHPVPDQNSFDATAEALELVSGLNEDDTVLFLVSGGGSALFEAPLIDGGELADLTSQLLRCGASIQEMNTVRKHLSRVKGGRFAQACAPAQVLALILSDVVGNDLDVIASGPAVPDTSTCADAQAVIERYGLVLSEAAAAALATETPKELDNVEHVIAGGVETLCEAMADACARAGYEPMIHTTRLVCDVTEAAQWFVEKATNDVIGGRHALICGGETVVEVTGTGLGGRNQEMALRVARDLAGKQDWAFFSLGSDGTDGPTDAAGGYCDTTTWQAIGQAGLDAEALLANNDAYHALDAAGALLKTGPTGTNVNDVSVLLLG